MITESKEIEFYSNKINDLKFDASLKKLISFVEFHLKKDDARGITIYSIGLTGGSPSIATIGKVWEHNSRDINPDRTPLDFQIQIDTQFLKELHRILLNNIRNNQQGE